MSEKTVYSCDACFSELPEDYNTSEHRIHIPIGLESDPAGGASTTDSRPIDLCPRCLANAVNEFVNKKSSFQYNTVILQIMRNRNIFTLNIKNMDLDGSVLDRNKI